MTKQIRKYFLYVIDSQSLHEHKFETGGAEIQTLPLQKKCYRLLQAKSELPNIGDFVAAFSSEVNKPLSNNTKLVLFAHGSIVVTPKDIPLEANRPIRGFRYWFDIKVTSEWNEQFPINELNIVINNLQIPALFKVEESLYARIIERPKLKALEKRLNKEKWAQGLVWDHRFGHFLTFQEHLELLPDDDILAAIKLRLRRPKSENFFSKIESIYLNEASSSLRSLSPRDFERLCTRIVQKLGFAALRTRSTGDQGIDIIAEDQGNNFRRGRYIFQCKRTMSVGAEVVRLLIGSLDTEKAIKGILLTTGVITKAAREEASANARIELVDGLSLKKLVDSISNEPSSHELTKE